MKPKIVNIDSADDFLEMSLSIFNYQASQNIVYKQYVTSLKINPNTVKELSQIPFLPISFFKTHKIITENEFKEGENINNQKVFTSSGTTKGAQSKHVVTDMFIYEKSYLTSFNQFYGNIQDYCILALLPSYLEREGSSLIYMVDDLIVKSKHPKSGFYLNNYTDLLQTLKELEGQNKKTILLGVSYALLDLAALFSSDKTEKFQLKNTIIMETGGMKGKRKEMIKEELHTLLCKSFGLEFIHSEYGMTELLSQAYSKGNGIFFTPPWMKALIRDVNDPFSFLPVEKSGGLNIIDLANINSCSFIATQDLGKIYTDGSFEVLGRFDESDIRGCNLLVE